ncbi:uncharacterized protein LOC122818739 [Drosophila biarmipes]|uniref:uncharacterized protein LOC122818739 n=1 Tax=Drosophila biarmipes TaxID=125945 RepID=UPI0021CCAE3C|nr:uncharacterized protein LOC122818739 [Drosophila biarmipes]
MRPRNDFRQFAVIHLEPTSDRNISCCQVQVDSGRTFVGVSPCLCESVAAAHLAIHSYWGTTYGGHMGSWCQELQDLILQIHRYTQTAIFDVRGTN